MIVVFRLCRFANKYYGLMGMKEEQEVLVVDECLYNERLSEIENLKAISKFTHDNFEIIRVDFYPTKMQRLLRSIVRTFRQQVRVSNV